MEVGCNGGIDLMGQDSNDDGGKGEIHFPFFSLLFFFYLTLSLPHSSFSYFVVVKGSRLGVEICFWVGREDEDV